MHYLCVILSMTMSVYSVVVVLAHLSSSLLPRPVETDLTGVVVLVILRVLLAAMVEQMLNAVMLCVVRVELDLTVLQWDQQTVVAQIVITAVLHP
jgi:hypothetical protein